MQPVHAPSKKANARKKVKTEDRREMLLTSCIDALKNPTVSATPSEPACHFSLYIAQKVKSFTRRKRAIAEKKICDILFELEMQEETLVVPNENSVASSVVSNTMLNANTYSQDSSAAPPYPNTSWTGFLQQNNY